MQDCVMQMTLLYVSGYIVGQYLMGQMNGQL